MSKKTNEAKRKAAMKKHPRRRVHTRKRKGARPNPAYGKLVSRSLPGRLTDDPFFMHHAIGILLRYVELVDLQKKGIANEPLAGTDNSELPDDK